MFDISTDGHRLLQMNASVLYTIAQSDPRLNEPFDINDADDRCNLVGYTHHRPDSRSSALDLILGLEIGVLHWGQIEDWEALYADCPDWGSVLDTASSLRWSEYIHTVLADREMDAQWTEWTYEHLEEYSHAMTDWLRERGISA
ncbi:hypothetical protein [Luteococcus peritonei]|uniref:Uncharacterized protein n=1 Tax=Luteococcus peritonei TaxID=88874 RepID=A0ABW4RW77_9ACTN